MTDEKNSAEIDHGNVFASWEFPEFKKFKKSKIWYLVAIIVLALLVLFSVLTTNYLFIVIIGLFVVIYVMRNRLDPGLLPIQLTEDGVVIGEKTFYEWAEIKTFWIIYEPPEVKNLYLDFRSSFRATVSVSLENQNPLNIRKILLNYLKEDTEKENESFSDGLSRMLKL